MRYPHHISKTDNAAVATEPRHWANIKEATSTLGIRVLLGVYRVLGRRGFRVCVIPVLLWYMMTKPVARAASYQYLNRIAAVRGSPPATFFDVLSHFIAFGESILDKFLLAHHRFDESRVTIGGLPMMLERVEKKQGALIMCAHFGNLEICKVLSQNYPGVKITMLIHDRHAPQFSKLLNANEAKERAAENEVALDAIQVTEITPHTMMLLKARIDAGEMIVIAGDRIPVSETPRTATAPFLGKPAAFPVGAYVLASLLETPIYLMFVVQSSHHKNANIHIAFEHFSDVFSLPRRDRNALLSQLAQQFAARLEHYCLQEPRQWFNFFDFWQSPSKPTR